MTQPDVTVRLVQQRDYAFDVHFGAGVPVWTADEPPPLGAGAGPSPVQLLAAAVGNCLSDSLLFALRKFKQAPEPVGAEVVAHVGRNAEGRVRVLSLEVQLTLGVPGDTLDHLDRVLSSFESYCTVSQSVAPAIPLTVQVYDSHGARLK